MARDYAKKDRPFDKGAAAGKGTSVGKGASVGKGTSARKSAATRRPAPVKTARPAPKRHTAPARAQHGALSLKWILSLAAVGGFIGFIVYLNTLPTGSESQTAKPPVSAPATEKPAPAVTAPSKDKEPNFRFYDMLPESEVVPPKVNEYSPNPSQQEFTYLVQSGSFRQQEDAERQRAQIAFQGLRAQVQRIDLDNGSVWYRVNVGPFTSRSQMNSAVDKLVSINIQPLVRKIPNEG
jgi:cell division septation protein DedD